MKPWIFVLLTLFSLSACAQNETPEIDRYKAVLDTVAPGQGIAAVYNDLAWEYFHTDYDSSIHYAEKALNYSIEIHDQYWHAVSLEMMALLCESRGDIDGAIALYLQVIPLREEIGGQGLENTYTNMGAAFKTIENYQKALTYFRKSLKIETKNKNIEGIAGSLINLAITERRLGNMDSVSFWLKDAISLSDEIDNTSMKMHALLNLGGVYQEFEQLDSAKIYFEESLSLSRFTHDSRSGTIAALGLGEVAGKEGNYEEALAHLAEAESLVLEVNIFDYLSRIYRSRSEIYERQGNYKAALKSQSRFIEIHDSIMNLEVISLTAELEGKYQNERAERQITEMQLEAIERELAAETGKKERRVLIFASVLLVMLVAFLTYRYFKKAETSRLLTEKNKTIALALNDREVLLKEIHHRVKNNLQVVSSLLSIQGREISDKKALEAVNESKHRVHSMALIHQYLYSDNDLKSIDMQQYITELCKRLFSAYRLDHDLVELRIEVDPIHVDVDTAVPMGIVINELITNALKYAFPDNREGFLLIKLREDTGKLHLSVSDNGVGKSAVAREGFSFGSKLIDAFKKKLEADLEINHKNGYHVQYTIGKYKLWEGSTAS